jgi:hypothetical protein
MADLYGKQGVRTLDDGDVAVGILKTGDTRIDPALEAGNLKDVKDRIGDVTSPATGSTNDLLTRVLAALGGGTTDIADYKVNNMNAADGVVTYDYTCLADTNLLNVVCSASVYSTFLISIDPTGVAGFTPHWMGIVSEGSPAAVINCEGYKVLTNGIIRVSKRNYNPGASKYDLHSTFNMQQ